MKQSDIRAFIYNYIDENGTPVEAITKYCYFNKEKVLKDQEKIVSFFIGIYDFKETMSLHSLLTNKEGIKLFTFKTIFDLDDFENLVGLLLISNIFQEDFFLRFKVFNTLNQESHYFERSLHSLDTSEDEEEYVSHIEHFILPYYKFNINVEFVEEYKKQINSKKLEAKNKKVDSEIFIDENPSDLYSLKEVLGYWFHKSKLPITKEIDKFFDILLETRLEAVVNFMVMANILHGDGPTSLVLNIINNNVKYILNDVEEQYSTLSKKAKANFEYVKECVIVELSKEMQEKNKSL